MDSKIKISLACSVILLAVIAVRIAMIHHERTAVDAPVADNSAPTPADYLVFLKQKDPDSLKDEKDLIGQPIWVHTAGQVDYYPYAAHHADYAKPAGTLLGADKLTVVDAFEQVAPANAKVRMPLGQRQMLLVFTHGTDPKQYATPVGYKDADGYHILTDSMFFYDDPHKLYDYWGAKNWDAIDHHQAIPGMSENQMALSLGQVVRSDSNTMGDRTVTYYNLGNAFVVQYQKDKAISVQPTKW